MLVKTFIYNCEVFNEVETHVISNIVLFVSKKAYTNTGSNGLTGYNNQICLVSTFWIALQIDVCVNPFTETTRRAQNKK